MLAGTALAVKGRSPRTRVIAVEPANADDARRSLEAGSIQHCDDPSTIADGLRTTSIGERNFAVIARQVDRIVTVSEAEIVDAMRFVWERIKIVIEPSSAVAVAPLLTGKLEAARPARRGDPERRQCRPRAVFQGTRGEMCRERIPVSREKSYESADHAGQAPPLAHMGFGTACHSVCARQRAGRWRARARGCRSRSRSSTW